MGKSPDFGKDLLGQDGIDIIDATSKFVMPGIIVLYSILQALQLMKVPTK